MSSEDEYWNDYEDNFGELVELDNDGDEYSDEYNDEYSDEEYIDEEYNEQYEDEEYEEYEEQPYPEPEMVDAYSIPLQRPRTDIPVIIPAKRKKVNRLPTIELRWRQYTRLIGLYQQAGRVLNINDKTSLTHLLPIEVNLMDDVIESNREGESIASAYPEAYRQYNKYRYGCNY